MLYGFQTPDAVFVVAGDTPTAFEVFARGVGSEEGVTPEDVDFLFNPQLRGLQDAIRFTPEVASRIGVEIVSREDAVKRNSAMRASPAADPYASDSELPSIRDIYNLAEDDPWDNRSAEEKEEEEKLRKKFKEAEKGGGLSGESFSPDSGDLRVQEVHGERGTDGKITVSRVTAEKGLWGERTEEVAQARVPYDFHKIGEQEVQDIFAMLGEDIQSADGIGIASGVPYVTISDPGLANRFWTSVDRRGITVEVTQDDGPAQRDDAAALAFEGTAEVGVYFRVWAEGASLDDLLHRMSTGPNPPDRAFVARGETMTAVWGACIIERLAREAAEVLGSGAVVEAVDRSGMAILEDSTGIKVVDHSAEEEIGPRPWDDDTSAWEALSDDERTAEIKKIKGSEITFTGFYHLLGGSGTHVFFVPKAWWARHGEDADPRWYGDYSVISHLLLEDLKAAGDQPGHFTSQSRDFDKVAFNLHRKGMLDNTALRLFLNNRAFQA